MKAGQIDMNIVEDFVRDITFMLAQADLIGIEAKKSELKMDGILSGNQFFSKIEFNCVCGPRVLPASNIVLRIFF